MKSSEIWKILKDFIESNISDPKNRHQVSLVHSGELKPAATNFIGYPYIRLTPVVFGEETKTNSGVLWKEFTTTIMVYGTDYPTVDRLFDDLINLFTSTESQYNLSKQGISHYIITNYDLDERTIDGKDVIIKQFNLKGWIT